MTNTGLGAEIRELTEPMAKRQLLFASTSPARAVAGRRAGSVGLRSAEERTMFMSPAGGWAGSSRRVFTNRETGS